MRFACDSVLGLLQFYDQTVKALPYLLNVVLINVHIYRHFRDLLVYVCSFEYRIIMFLVAHLS